MSDKADDADAALRAASVSSLLTAAYSLTHRLHAARKVPRNEEELLSLDLLTMDLRAQRDRITAEIIRRCSDED